MLCHNGDGIHPKKFHLRIIFNFTRSVCNNHLNNNNIVTVLSSKILDKDPYSPLQKRGEKIQGVPEFPLFSILLVISFPQLTQRPLLWF